jgi:hypothetical protein
MKLTMHIIRKDLLRMRWSVLIWALSLGYLFLRSRLRPGIDNMADFLQLTAVMLTVVVGVGLIADLMQSDHPTRSDAHWRGLPITGRRLVAAKLLLLGGLFVILPIFAATALNLTSSNSAFRNLRHLDEYLTIFLVLSAVSLSLAATAACTKNVVHSLGLWLGLFFTAGTLASYLDRFAPILSRQALAGLAAEKAHAILALSVIVGVAVILNQYLRRQVVLSVALLLFGSVGAALIGTMWGYFYFYSSQ